MNRQKHIHSTHTYSSIFSTCIFVVETIEQLIDGEEKILMIAKKYKIIIILIACDADCMMMAVYPPNGTTIIITTTTPFAPQCISINTTEHDLAFSKFCIPDWQFSLAFAFVYF